MATKPFIRYFIDHSDTDKGPLTGKTLYAVPAGDSFNTDNPLTEDGTWDGYYKAAALEGGVWDIFDNAQQGSPYEQDVLHGIDDNEVTNSKIANGAVTSAKIGDDQVTTSKVADDAITGAKIANSAIVAAHIASAQVNQSHLASDSVGNPELIDNSVDGDKIADNAIVAAHIADGQVNQAALATNSVGSPELIDGNVGTSHIADLAITGAKIFDLAVTTAKLDDHAVTTGKVADNAITGLKLATNSVSNQHIVNNAVNANKIEDGSISAIKMSDFSISANKLQEDSVTEPKIADGAVTTSKYAMNSVDSNALGLNSVQAEHISNDTITLAMLTSALQTWITTNAGTGADITNNPDDLTIEENGSNQLQLKDLGIQLNHLAATVKNELQSREVVFAAANDSIQAHKDHAGSTNTCDGTDDQLVLNTLVDDNKVLCLLPGTYHVDPETTGSATTFGCLHVESKSKFAIICLPGAIIKKEATVSNNYAVKLWECSDVLVQVEIDGNKAVAGGGGIQFAACDRYIIEKSHIHDCDTHGIAHHGGVRFICRDNFLEGFDNAHAIDLNDDEDDHADRLNQYFLIAGNNIDLESGGGFDTIKLEDMQYGEVAHNICRSHAGASNLVIQGDSGDEADSTAWLDVHHNQFIGGDTSLINLRFGTVRVQHNHFSNKIQIGGGGGGDVWFNWNHVVQPDVNSALVIFGGESGGNVHQITHNEFEAPNTGTESKTISFTWDTGTTDYQVFFESNTIKNFRTLAIEVDADMPTGYKPVIRNNFLISSEDAGGNLDGIKVLCAQGAIIDGNTIHGCKRSIILNNSDRNEVTRNVLKPFASATAGIIEENGSDYNNIHHNHFMPGGLSRMEYIITTGSNTIVEYNSGADAILTEIMGVATIPDGSVTVDITMPANFIDGFQKQFNVSFASVPAGVSHLFVTFHNANTLRIEANTAVTADVDVRYVGMRLHPYFAA